MSNAPKVQTNRIIPPNDLYWFAQLPIKLQRRLANASIWINSETIWSIYQNTKSENQTIRAIEQIENAARDGVI